MITAFVQIRLPKPISEQEVLAAFEASAPTYQGLTGLVRKYYLYDGVDHVGGFYVWQDWASAKAVHTDPWLQSVGERYGATAEIRYFEVPVLVDNGSIGV